MVASTAVSTLQTLDKGEQEQDYHNFQAEQADADATAEREAGEVRASKIRKASKGTQSEAVAALAASGVEVRAGTPLKIEGEIVRNAEEDALNEILYGERKGRRLTQQGQVERAAGERASDSATMGAFGSVLSGGAKLVGPGWKRAATGTVDWGASGDFPDGGAVRIA